MRTLLLVLLLAPIVAAAQMWGVASLGSYHLERGDHCEVNPGFGVEGTGTQRWLGGVYRNSDCDWTLYGARAWLPLSIGAVRAGAIGALLIGYEERPVLLAGGLMLTVEGREWGANLLFFPSKRGDFGEGVIGLQLKRTF